MTSQSRPIQNQEFMKMSPEDLSSKATKDAYGGKTTRRRVPRRTIDYQIGLLVCGKYMFARAHELGEGGLLISSPVPLKKGQRIVVTIRMPGILNSVMLSQVVYILEPEQSRETVKYGIQFEQIEFDTKRKIRNFVASSAGSTSAT